MRASAIGVGLQLLFAGSSPIYAQVQSSPPALPTHRVDVVLASQGDARLERPRLVVTAPSPAHQVRGGPGETIEWVFTNNSIESLTLTVGHFRAPARWAHLNEPREVPIESLFGGPIEVVAVAPGQTATLRARIKNQLQHHPRTYEYDIIDQSTLRVLLDPEIEIPK